MTLWLRSCQVAFLAGCVALLFAAPAQAVSITYDEDDNNRPTSFTELNIDGWLFDVTVEWGGSYNDAYGSGASYVPPYFIYDEEGAIAAVTAMQTALLDEGYSPIAPTSYLWVPYNEVVNGTAVYLHASDPDLPIGGANIYDRDNSHTTVGYTHFGDPVPIPEPATLWFLGAALAALGGMQRKLG